VVFWSVPTLSIVAYPIRSGIFCTLEDGAVVLLHVMHDSASDIVDIGIAHTFLQWIVYHGIVPAGTQSRQCTKMKNTSPRVISL
jgi:hypothetical protein